MTRRIKVGREMKCAEENLYLIACYIRFLCSLAPVAGGSFKYGLRRASEVLGDLQSEGRFANVRLGSLDKNIYLYKLHVHR